MNFILTLVAAHQPLTAGHLALVGGMLADFNIATGAPGWLDPNKAADLPILQKPTRDQIRTLRLLLAPDRIDLFITAAAHRRKKLLLADMDSTIVTAETLDELAIAAGPEIQNKIAAITTRAMAGELKFAEALRTRVAMLKGLPATTLEHTRQEIIFSDGAKTFVQTMRAHGATCVLVSGGFRYFTQWVAAQAGFHADHANELLLDGDILNGTVAEPILGKEAKLEKLHDYCRQLNITSAETLTIGDGANDLPMLEAAGIGIGYHPKPLLRDTLDNCILHGDLTAALYAQGYRAADFTKS